MNVARLLFWFGLGLCFQACSNPVRAMAQEIANRTSPSHAGMLTAFDSSQSGSSLSFNWDLDAGMGPGAYLAWLQDQLRDFSTVDTAPNAMHLGKLVGGDAYNRLFVTAQSQNSANAHVHVELTVSPD